MKTYQEYNNDELLAFTDEEIAKLVDLQCALDGIALLPPEAGPEPSYNVAPDATVYDVAGFTVMEKESAQRIADAINAEVLIKVDYDWQLDRVNYINGYEENGPTIETKRVLSRDMHDKTKLERAKQKGILEQWSEMDKAYKNVYTDREEIADRIWGAVHKARAERDAKLDAMKRFERYVTLAEGDRKLANKFFTDAYPDDAHYLMIDEKKTDEAAA